MLRNGGLGLILGIGMTQVMVNSGHKFILRLFYRLRYQVYCLYRWRDFRLESMMRMVRNNGWEC
jgi:hypothetical protein